MNVDFTVDVIPGERILGPRIKTADAVISMGLTGSLDDALREATNGMAEWLSETIAPTPRELSEVCEREVQAGIGTSQANKGSAGHGWDDRPAVAGVSETALAGLPGTVAEWAALPSRSELR